MCINKLKYGEITGLTNPETYRMFSDKSSFFATWSKYIAECEEWGQGYKQSMALRNQLIEEHPFLDSLEYYCGYGYKRINRYLRSSTKDPSMDATIASLTYIICTAPPLQENIILYRKACSEMINQLIDKNKHNHPYIEKGFLSTSYLKQGISEVAGSAILKIYAGAKMRGVCVDLLDGLHRNEFEFLFCPNVWLRLVNYPYKDEETGLQVYECHAFHPVVMF